MCRFSICLFFNDLFMYFQLIHLISNQGSKGGEGGMEKLLRNSDRNERISESHFSVVHIQIESYNYNVLYTYYSLCLTCISYS